MLTTLRERSTLFYYAALTVIIVLSWSIYSSGHYPLLSSDDALNILMAHFYELPEDIYCWGQDRGGTVIPLISQIYIKIFGTSAIDAVSLANYTVIILGYIGFSSLLNKKWSRLLFALIWFFPFQRFVDLNRYPIGVQYSLIAFGIYLIRKVEFDDFKLRRVKNHLLLLATTLIFGLAIWASDLAAISLVILFGSLYLYRILKQGSWKIRWEIPLYKALGAIAFGSLILYGKNQAAAFSPKQFGGLNSFQMILDGLSLIGHSIADAASFVKTENPFIVLYVVLVPILFSALVVLLVAKKIQIHRNQQAWFTYFSLDAVGIFGVILLSEWVLVNGMGRWYFVGTYIMVSISLLTLLENLQLKTVWKRSIIAFGWLVVLIGSISTPYDLAFVRPKTLRSTASEIRELDKLGEIGIIGDYWNAYKFAAVNPDKIAATAYEGGNIRNMMMTAEVFTKPSIYLFPDGWLNGFPDTVQQFGLKLLKRGRPFNIAGHNTCRYIRESLNRRYTAAELTADSSSLQTVNEKTMLQLDPKQSSAIHVNVLNAPTITLTPGKYQLRYHVKVDATTEAETDLFTLEMGSPYEVAAFRHIKAKDIQFGRFNYETLEITVDHLFINASVHFIYRGVGTVWLDEIQLIEQ